MPRTQEAAGSKPATLTNSLRMTNRPGGRDRLEHGACRKAWGSRPQSSARFASANFGGLTGRGAGDAWKAFGTRKRVSIVRSIFRQLRVAVFDGAPSHFFDIRKVNRTGVRHPFEAGRHRKVWGSRPRLSASSLAINPIREVPVRTGWCRRRAVNAVPLGQEVRFHPLPTNLQQQRNTRIWSIGWAPERHSGDGGSIPSIRTNSRRGRRINSLRKLIW